jgi:hypothetical protein
MRQLSKNEPARMSDSFSTEHESLLALLGEYSVKLRDVSRSFHERKSRLLLFGISGSVATALLGILGWLGLSVMKEMNEVTSSLAITFMTVLITVVSAILILFSFRSFSDRDQVAEFEIIPLQRALRRLLIRASRLETHSITNSDEKILFDLRLAEAESALALSEWVLATRQSPLSFSASKRTNQAKAMRRAPESSKSRYEEP